jgi:hypothetical protein
MSKIEPTLLPGKPRLASDDSKLSDVQSISDDESKKENDLQNSFNDLLEKFSTLRNDNLKILKDVRDLELERDILLHDLSDSFAVCNSLKSENHVLIAKLNPYRMS